MLTVKLPEREPVVKEAVHVDMNMILILLPPPTVRHLIEI